MEINNKELKQILKEQSEDFKRHVSTLAEDFHSQVKLIGEQYGSIKETLDSHTEMIVSLKEDMEIVKTDIGFVKNFLKRKIDIEEFSVLERRVAALESKIKVR
jgi:hypothetical protein